MNFATKALRSTLIIGAFAGASAVIAQPASAAPATCASFQVNGSIPYNTLFGAGFECIAGDKIYSNFNTPSAALASAAPEFTIADNDPFHTLTAEHNFTGGAYSFFYTVALDLTQDPNRTFLEFNTDFTLTGFLNPPQLDGTKILQVASVGTSTATKRVPGVSPGNSVLFGPGVTSATFFSSLTVTPGSLVTNFSDTLLQSTRSTSVPGPLPILGAAAAFSFSRKLRRRVKQTV
jgi:hypothetical protein